MKPVNDRHRRIQENYSYHRKFAKIKTTHVNWKQYNIQSKSLIAIDDIRKEKILRSSFFSLIHLFFWPFSSRWSLTYCSWTVHIFLIYHTHHIPFLLRFFSFPIHLLFMDLFNYSSIFTFTYFSLLIHLSYFYA